MILLSLCFTAFAEETLSEESVTAAQPTETVTTLPQSNPASAEDNSAVEKLMQSSNILFILLGAVMILAMHAGFAFLEVGSVRKRNQLKARSEETKGIEEVSNGLIPFQQLVPCFYKCHLHFCDQGLSLNLRMTNHLPRYFPVLFQLV